MSSKHVDLDRKVYDNKHVSQFLVDMVNLAQYYDLFIDNGIECNDTIVLLTNNILKEIGVKKIGHRLAIMNAIPKVKEKIALESEGR